MSFDESSAPASTADGVRYDRPVSFFERIGQAVVGAGCGALSIYLALDDRGGVGFPGAFVVVVPATVFGLVLIWMALAYRGKVISVDGDALVIRKLPAPFAKERVRRIPASEIEQVRVEELYDNDWPPGQDWRWRTVVAVRGRRPIELAGFQLDRPAVLAKAERLRSELGLAVPLWAETKQPGTTTSDEPDRPG